MSWHFSSIGSRAAVRAAVLVAHLPLPVENLIVTTIDESQKVRDTAEAQRAAGERQTVDDRTHVRVETHGHIDGSCGGSIGKFELQFFKPAAEPVLTEPAVLRAVDASSPGPSVAT
jgi:hypothetical protein